VKINCNPNLLFLLKAYALQSYSLQGRKGRAKAEGKYHVKKTKDSSTNPEELKLFVEPGN